MHDDTENVQDASPAIDWQGRTEPGESHSIAEFDSVVESVVFAVSALTGTDPVEMEPLYEIVDVDALEDLFAPKADGTPREGGTVSFTYCGCVVTVEGTDQVTVELKSGAYE